VVRGKMMQSKYKSIFKAGSLIGILMIGFVVGMVYLPSVHDAIYQQPKVTTMWHLIQVYDPLGAEGNPGAGASGFLEIFFINHSAAPDTAFNRNLSTTLESWCVANMPGKTPYASADNFKVELNYGILFDIVVRVRLNKTHAWNGVCFISSNIMVNITLTGFNTAGMSDLVGSQLITRNNSADSYIWLNYYWQDVDGAYGDGFTINKGSPWTTNQITKIKIWAKY
jgi:hypothetical protein